MFSFFLLCTVFASASSYCFRAREYVDAQLGFETEYGVWDSSEEAQFWWGDGETDSDGNCIEPWNTYSCDPEAWTTENHNATLFTCSEEDGDTPARCNLGVSGQFHHFFGGRAFQLSKNKNKNSFEILGAIEMG